MSITRSSFSSRALSWSLLFLLASAGCEGPEDPAPLDSEAAEAPLLQATSTRLWPRNRTIPVCLSQDSRIWDEGGPPTHLGWARDQAIAAFYKWAVPGTTLRYVFVSSDANGKCPIAEDHIKITVVRKKFYGDIAGVSSTWGRSASTAIRVGYCDTSIPDNDCNGRHPTPHARKFRHTLLHEIGHALGFHHEHQRKDTPPEVGHPVSGWCNDAKPDARKANPVNNGFVENGRFLSVQYDHSSIMNYCRDRNGDRVLDDFHEDTLSAGDIEGIRASYR